ncbi:pilus assembly protein TadG-related protein [Cupriavidus gilardii]|uniref:pilus assembly protein TadG-related protein n=1 Tax=Cupriavidus gilardii TaxID=82541 RepID=UPI001580E766|nr:pilus assembly protein TadG-related protein [Cupriavidus gilardii]MCT9073405.1 pilus assembly protein TadG-related protein [Cupriavidus gilardii]QKS64223.1 pilus assembly protein TadG [Cupriavidus gilardii]
MMQPNTARPHPRRRAATLRRQQGAVAIVVALALVAMVGFLGLALDLGKLYVAKSELQNGADACALAAARDLTGATPLAVSEAAGITAGYRNLALFQSESVQFAADSSVTYSDALANPFYPKSSVPYALDTIKYVKCAVSRAGIANWFAQVLNLLPGGNVGPSTVSSFAVATVGAAQTACAIPVFICKPDTISPPEPPYTVGQWLISKLDAGNKGEYGGGNFGWADLGGGSGTKSLAEQLKGSGQCNLPALGTEIGTTGNKSSLADEWNSRFGIVKAGKVVGVPDFTGHAYNDTTWPAKANAYPDFTARRKAYAPYQGDSVAMIDTKGSPSGTAAHQGGADRRMVLAPVVDCSGFAVSGTHKASVLEWACLLMIEPMQWGGNINSVRLEYRGASSSLGSPCATQGIPGLGSGPGPLVPVLVQ